MTQALPVVLCFSGHDPSGGAGIQADIETLNSHQCHACSVITALTEQDTQNVRHIIPQTAAHIISQAQTILADVTVDAIKIGLLGHVDTAIAIHQIISEHPQIPVILDPILAAGGGKSVADNKLIEAIIDLLLPCTYILTPNSREARKLTMLEDLNQCGLSLLEKGCDYVLITGSHEDTPSVSNQLFHEGHCMETYRWDRLPSTYHGSGCTLAASIAAMTASRLYTPTAILEAQEYTWNSLKAAYKPGKGQHIPQRFFWMHEQQ